MSATMGQGLLPDNQQASPDTHSHAHHVAEHTAFALHAYFAADPVHSPCQQCSRGQGRAWRVRSMAVSFSFTETEQQCMAGIVCDVISARLRNEAVQPPHPEDYPPALQKHLGCFVTLTIMGNLRGCIGSIVGREPLVTCVWNMAQAAAFRDPRFIPLRASEWPLTEAEITVLDELSLCPDPGRIEIGRHGLVLQYGGRSGVFLPQVPVEQGWNLEQYLSNLCRKAGLPDGTWQRPGARLFWYEGFKFQAKKQS